MEKLTNKAMKSIWVRNLSYFHVGLDQIFISLTSTFVSFYAFWFLKGQSLANFVFSWTLLWGAIAILSETLVTPLRVKFNISVSTHVIRQEIEKILHGLLFLGITCLGFSLLYRLSGSVSIILISVCLISAVTSFTLRRNILIDSNLQVRNLIVGTLLLLSSLSILILEYKLKFFVTSGVILSISSGYLITQFPEVLKLRKSWNPFQEVVRVISMNFQYGISTLLRIALFTAAILAILHQSYGQSQVLAYGLLLNLSNPGIVITSIVAQIEFKKLAKFVNLGDFRKDLKYFSLRLLTCSVIGTLLAIFLAVSLSKYSANYSAIISYIGIIRLTIYVFLCVLLVGISGIFSNLLQIFSRRCLQIEATLTGGLLGIISTFLWDPMSALFIPYGGYTLAAIILLNRIKVK